MTSSDSPGRDGRRSSRRARRAQRGRRRRIRRERPRPRPDRRHGLRRLRSGHGRAGARLRRRREALPSRRELEQEENLEGLDEDRLDTFRRRAVPEPGGVLREAPRLTNESRLDLPTTVICTGFTSDQMKAAVEEGYAWLGGLAELRDVTWVDLPTSHWPMWSRPHELAAQIGDVARGTSAR